MDSQDDGLLIPIEPILPVESPVEPPMESSIGPTVEPATTIFHTLDEGFPDLVQQSGGVLHATATGVPSNGQNTFLLGISSELIDDIDWLNIEIFAQGESVTNAEFVEIAQNEEGEYYITVNFTQTGSDQAKVVAKYTHSIVR